MGRNSANILALGWLITLLGAIGLGLTLTLDLHANEQNQGFVAGNCLKGNSFFEQTDLTRGEIDQFSSNAMAYTIIGVSNSRYRLILDYRISGADRQLLQTRIFITSIELPDDLKLKILLNGATEGEATIDTKPYYYLTKDLTLNSDKASLALSLYRDSTCEFSTQELVVVDKTLQYGEVIENWQDSPVLANFQESNINLKPGDNFVSFDDWIYLKEALNKGVAVDYFSPKFNKWLALRKDNAIVWPGRVYRLHNFSSHNIALDISKNFRVPNDLNAATLQKGWNLVNLSKSSLSDNKFCLNPDPVNLISSDVHSLKDLIESEHVTKIYAKDAQEALDLQSPEKFKSGQYWVFLENEKQSSFKIPNLVLDLVGAGDSYSSSTIPLKFTVENKDRASHWVVSSDVADPCQIGIRVKDKKNNLVFDDYGSANCPLWPKLEELKINQKKEYNYLWKPPSGLKGDYIMELYFSYSRLPGNRLIKSSSITLK